MHTLDIRLEVQCKGEKCLNRNPKTCKYKHNKYEDINLEDEIDKLKCEIKELRYNAKDVLNKVHIKEMEELQLKRTIQENLFPCHRCDMVLNWRVG